MIRHSLLWIIFAATYIGTATADEKKEWPTDMEQRIWSHLSENAHLRFTSIPLVKCDTTMCDIRITGPDIHANQTVYQEFINEFIHKLLAERVPVRQYATARMEISPGVEGYRITLSNQWAASSPSTGSPRAGPVESDSADTR